MICGLLNGLPLIGRMQSGETKRWHRGQQLIRLPFNLLTNKGWLKIVVSRCVSNLVKSKIATHYLVKSVTAYSYETNHQISVNYLDDLIIWIKTTLKAVKSEKAKHYQLSKHQAILMTWHWSDNLTIYSFGKIYRLSYNLPHTQAQGLYESYWISKV